MPTLLGSPSRTTRSKRESFTITRSVGKALTDVMNKDKVEAAIGGSTNSSTESDVAGTATSPTRTRTIAGPKRVAATTREPQRGGRPSLDVARDSASEKQSPKLLKRPPPSAASKSATRQEKSSAPPASSVRGDPSPSKASDKPSKPRSSLTLRGLSSALQSKSNRPPSALPKYKPKAAPDAKPELPRSGARKRLSDWDAEKEEDKDKSKNVHKGSDEEGEDDDDDDDDDFVHMERPISPLPRRAAKKPLLPASLSLTPATPPKKGNVLHKASSSISSTPPRKTAKTSTTPVARLQQSQSSVPRPSSSASARSQRATPVQASRKPASTSRARTVSSAHPVHQRPTLSDSPASSSSKLESSPANPFQLPETSGSSLLSPPLSPFLEGVSLDSIDAGDVSALLESVVSPVKPTTQANRDIPPQTPSRTLPILPDDPNSPPPQTPASQTSSRPISSFTTDPRQSVLSLRQFLENSGDLEYLLSQPLPSILTPDARERLLSFGFSPGIAPPPFPLAASRLEPQTPSPLPDERVRTFTSISQVLFPSTPSQNSTTEERSPIGREGESTPRPPAEDATVVELLKMQLSSAESQRNERDARIESLERQLISAREARERDAAELSTQVSGLEEQLKELLGDRERDSGRRAEELEMRLRDKDAEWEHQVAAAVSQVQERGVADQERLLSAERRKWCARSAAAAWECAKEAACSELELIRSNKSFVEVTLAGLDVSMQHLRQSLMR